MYTKVRTKNDIRIMTNYLKARAFQRPKTWTRSILLSGPGLLSMLAQSSSISSPPRRNGMMRWGSSYQMTFLLWTQMCSLRIRKSIPEILTSMWCISHKLYPTRRRKTRNFCSTADLIAGMQMRNWTCWKMVLQTLPIPLTTPPTQLATSAMLAILVIEVGWVPSS